MSDGRDVGIGRLLEGQADVEADGLAAGLVGAAIGRFHDARTAAGGDHEAMAPRRNAFGPVGEQLRQAARIFVVAGHLDGGHGALALQIGGLACGDLGNAGRLLFAGGGTGVEPVLSSSSSSWSASSRPRNRAEPKKTTVS